MGTASGQLPPSRHKNTSHLLKTFITIKYIVNWQTRKKKKNILPILCKLNIFFWPAYDWQLMMSSFEVDATDWMSIPSHSFLQNYNYEKGTWT
jgi:hypothetical protein